MKKVYLHGELGRKFGTEWVLNADSLADILRAIDANKDGFFHHLVKEIDSGAEYIFIKKDLNKIKSKREFEENAFYESKYENAKIDSEEIHITRCPEGGIEWAISSFIGWVKSGGLFKAILFAGISYGIQMLMKPPEPPKVDSKRVSTKSYILNGATNRTAQGIPVPIAYGRLKVGSINIGVEKELKLLNHSKANDNNMNTLESYSIFKYLELLCEGPIEGFVDQFGNLVDEENLEKAVFLNDVPIKNINNQLNFILTEDDQKPIEYAKGADDEIKFLTKDSLGNPIGAPYIRNYETLLYGPPPYVTFGNEANKSYISEEVQSQVADVGEIDFAVNSGAKIFSHAVNNPNVNKLSIAFKVELSYRTLKGDTLDNRCSFAILVERDGREYNVLNDDSGCQVEIPSHFMIEGLGTEKGSLKLAGIRKVPISESLQDGFESKANFGKRKWEELTELEQNARKFKPISSEEWIDSYEDNTDFGEQSEKVKQSYEIFVDNNSDLKKEYNLLSKNQRHFQVIGLATSPFEFNIDVSVDWDYFGKDNADKSRGIIFKVIKLSHEYDPTKDEEGENISGIYNTRNLQLSYIQERINAVLRYPHSAVTSVVFDSRNFSNVPNRSYHAKLKKVLIPSNYNSYTRKYSGPWDGLFKGQRDSLQQLYSIADNEKKWSDNPAWVFFDLVTNPRFGIAKYGVEETDIDKWQLYKIAKYCDELVETEYAIETKTGLPRAFSTDNQLKTDLNGEDGYLEVIIEKYFWYEVKEVNGEVVPFYQETNLGDDVSYKSKYMGEYFSDASYVPGGINSREDEVSALNINLIFQDMLERDATVEETDLYVNENITVQNLISIILNNEEFLKPTFSEEDFRKEFGDADSYKGKRVAFFLNKHSFFGFSEENKNKIQRESSLRSGSYEIEERIIISSDPSKRSILVSGPTFEENSTALDGKTYGACATQINHPIVEPRFTSNVYISDKSKALDVLNAMSSVFRGIIAYYGGRISPMQDGPKKPIKIFNNSNISQEGFSYAGGPKNKKFTSSIVKFNNKEKNFKPDVVFEEDIQGIQRLGFLENETIGFGVTSPSQARRLARWNLITPNLENDVIKFTAFLEANVLAPGLVFEVCDEMRTGGNRSGRILGIEMYKEISGQKVLDPVIIIDKNISDLPVFSRIEISVSTGRPSQSYEIIDNRAKDEKSYKDQDVEIDNLFSEQVLRFEASIVPSDMGTKKHQLRFKVSDLLIKIPFTVSISDNTIESIFHGFANGDKVRFVSEGVLPSGIKKSMIGDKAYTVENVTDHTFQISEYNSQNIVVIRDEGRDSLLNQGGYHYVCPESDLGVISNKTLEALDQISEGSTYIIKGLTSLQEDPLSPIVFNQDQLDNLYVNVGFEPRKKDWVFSELFGDINIQTEDYIYSPSLGWIAVGALVDTDPGSTGLWFYINGFEWVFVQRSDLDFWYFKSFEGHASINPWLRIYKDASKGEITNFFVEDSDYASKNVGDFVFIGSSLQRKMHIKSIQSSYNGYILSFENAGSSTFIAPPSSPPALSQNNQKLNPAFVEFEVEDIYTVDAIDSIQNKRCIRIQLFPFNSAELIKNLDINIDGVQHNVQPSNFDQAINAEWNSIYVSNTIIEILDSEQLYDDLTTEGSNFSQKGFISYLNNEAVIQQRIQGSKLYRVVSCKEIKSNEFEIVGSEYNIEKFQAIDKNYMIRKPDVPIPPQADMTIPDAPVSLYLSDLTFRP